jgi:D-methionine transport system substrate-binding protein
MKKISYLLLLSFIMTFFAVGCSKPTNESNSKNDEKKEIVIGVSSVSKDLGYSGKEELEKMGYKVDIKVFDDYVLPNNALVEGSIDANFYQHESYMINYNKSKKSDIVMLEPKLYNYYSGLYSVKANKIEDLPEGGYIGIAEDASNMSEQLKQFEEAGLIKLNDKPSIGEFFTPADVIENKKNYKFGQGDGNKYKNMEDYTCLIGTSNTMAEAGIDPTKNLLKKFVDPELALGISVIKENKDKQWVNDIMKAYSSEVAKSKVPKESGFEAAE